MARVCNIKIDGREVPFRASAAIPRLYRARFGRDIFRDLNDLVADFNRATEASETENDAEADSVDLSMLDWISLEIFENIAYTMAKHADDTIPNTPDEWLEGFDVFSIYQILPQILPQIIQLWGLNTQTDVTAKKKRTPRSAR